MVSCIRLLLGCVAVISQSVEYLNQVYRFLFLRRCLTRSFQYHLANDRLNRRVSRLARLGGGYSFHITNCD